MEKQIDVVTTLPMSAELIERRIYLVRGIKVMLDSDLAELYRVSTKVLNQAVKRNMGRFPSDFMFQLSSKEAETLRFQFGTSNLRSQFVTSSSNYGGRRFSPYVFTEQGVAMLSSVLKSEQAISVNIAIMRAFVKLREIMLTHKELERKIQDLERNQKKQKADISSIFIVINKLLEKPKEPEEPKERIGFKERNEPNPKLA
jgi:hypothetical protein